MGNVKLASNYSIIKISTAIVMLKKTSSEFPFSWVDLDYLPNSQGYRNEISIISVTFQINDLIKLYYDLFNHINDLKVYINSWWDFCLETWDIKNNDYDYNLNGKSVETVNYLKMLIDSNIEIGYVGSCIYSNSNHFLQIILECILNHKSPFSPIFYNFENQFFFYFHHSGSIGFYYKNTNQIVSKILLEAENKPYLSLSSL